MRRVRELVRALPPLSWRDAQIANLRERQDVLTKKLEYHRRQARTQARKIKKLEADLAAATGQDQVQDAVLGALRQPSFIAQLSAWKRDFSRSWRAADATDVRYGMNRKLAMYRLAESHGLRVPQVYGLWSIPEDIDWASLPDRFVIKSDGGAAGNGVLPLERVAGGLRLIGGSRVRDEQFYVALLRKRLDRGSIRAPFFVESLMEDPRTPGRLPADVKIYSFYGRVGHVLLRDMEQHADRATAHWRYLGPDGEDLGPVNLTVPVDPGVRVPDRLPELVRVAERLSLAVPLPFVRVDLYDLPDGIWFGELTLTPGGEQTYTEAHDRRLGSLWEQAASRLAKDLRTGRVYERTLGEHPVATPRAEDAPPARNIP